MILALLLALSPPRVKLRIESPTRPAGYERGRRLPPRRPPVRGRSWAVRAILTFPF